MILLTLGMHITYIEQENKINFSEKYIGIERKEQMGRAAREKGGEEKGINIGIRGADKKGKINRHFY